MLLVLNSGLVYAECMVLGSSGECNNGTINYADLERRQRAGHLARMWNLYDYTTAQTFRRKSYLSVKEQREYHCQQVTYRTLTFSLYAEHLGNGNIVGLDTKTRKWRLIAPESVAEKEWKVACSKE